MIREITIEDKLIGSAHKPFIIAEMSGNHNQSLEQALKIVEAAAKSGVDAIKLQTYTPDTMTLEIHEKEFVVGRSLHLWKGKSLYDLYQQAHTPWEWHEPIFNRAKDLGMIAFSTPFDETAVDFLEQFNVPMYKIASFENIDIPLIKKVASTRKPMIISTGMATAAELDEAVCIARQAGCDDLVLLKCTSAYPATPKYSNISTMKHTEKLFNCQIGVSDHTMGIGVAVASIALGATVIEKHFTLSRADGGVDADFSLEPQEMKLLVEETKRAWEALGTIHYGPTVAEKSSIKFRRSIYVSQDIKEGQLFTRENIKVIRPGFGLAPKYYEMIIGKTAKKDVKRGTALAWEHIL
ncbi:TPA: pseudaminic acid synthase [Bacillus cereus]|nr:pseudaminic acid synthase [Bacillus cereus]